jgi:hypothetical protein
MRPQSFKMRRIFFLCARYDETQKRMEDDYPRNMKNWRGVPVPLDAVITWKDGMDFFG